MASSGQGPQSSPSPRSGSSGASFQTLEPSQPDPPSGGEASGEERSKNLWTVVAIVAAAGLAAGTIYLASRFAGIPGVTEVVTVSAIAFGICLVAMVPMRWGLYVAPGVALMYFGYTVYNMFLNPESVFQLVPGEAYGYALSSLGVGALIGLVAQGLYSAILRA